MQGIINAAAQPEVPAQEPVQAADPAQAAPEAQQAQGPAYKSKVISAIPQQLREPFERVVLAGMKILYAKEMQPMIKQYMEAGGGEPWKMLAEGIAKIVRLVDSQAKKGVPQEILIPAAIELVHEYADFLNQSGKAKISPEDLQQASVYVAICVAKLYGVPDDKIQSMFGGQPGATPAAEDPEAQPPAEQPEAQPAVDPNEMPEEA